MVTRGPTPTAWLRQLDNKGTNWDPPTCFLARPTSAVESTHSVALVALRWLMAAESKVDDSLFWRFHIDEHGPV
ncbi:unnamed protein product [Leptosia nina]|uniref:Uncharacterized protein n=1 Tax=Leptosia nina TaxID=320188 RepID=A0AAV1K433_9NEOP